MAVHHACRWELNNNNNHMHNSVIAFLRTPCNIPERCSRRFDSDWIVYPYTGVCATSLRCVHRAVPCAYYCFTASSNRVRFPRPPKLMISCAAINPKRAKNTIISILLGRFAVWHSIMAIPHYTSAQRTLRNRCYNVIVFINYRYVLIFVLYMSLYTG